MAEAGAERGQKRPWAGWLASIFSRRRGEAEAEGGQPPGDAAVEAASEGEAEAVAEGDRRPQALLPPDEAVDDQGLQRTPKRSNATGEAAGDQRPRRPQALPPFDEAAGDQQLRSPPELRRRSAAGGFSPSLDDDQPEKKRPRLGDEKCCWLCLGEEGDADGGEGHLQRDCSCRGGSGWAHLSCLVEHAKSKTVVRYASDVRKSSEPWESCPCCLQPYQDTLALEMAHAFSTYAREKYPNPAEGWKRLGSFPLKCSVYIDAGMWKLAANSAELCLVVIKLQLQRAQAGNSSLSRLLLEFKALAFNHLGHAAFARGSGTDESKREAVSHFERSRALYNAMGCKEDAADAKRHIAIVKADMEGQYVALKRGLLEVAKAHYERDVAKFGRKSAAAIRSGIVYVERLYHCGSRGVPFFLWYAKSSLEAQRLATKLAGACKQLHGPGHRLTQKVEGVLREYQRRFVHVVSTSSAEGELYEALRYEYDGKTCVVQKACEEPGDEMEGPIRILTNQIRPMVGTPVVCQGLREATRYNGKIGFVAEPFDELTGCCKVRFEEGTLKPCPVSHEHLRILSTCPANRGGILHWGQAF